jgi:hypothetical protein
MSVEGSSFALLVVLFLGSLGSLGSLGALGALGALGSAGSVGVSPSARRTFRGRPRLGGVGTSSGYVAKHLVGILADMNGVWSEGKRCIAAREDLNLCYWSYLIEVRSICEDLVVRRRELLCGSRKLLNYRLIKSSEQFEFS